MNNTLHETAMPRPVRELASPRAPRANIHVTSPLQERPSPRRVRELASPRAPRDNIDVTSLWADRRPCPCARIPMTGPDPRNVDSPAIRIPIRQPVTSRYQGGGEEYSQPGG